MVVLKRVRNSVDKAVGKRGKKMTDNEIIEALKCCANLCKDGCNGCYLVPSESKDAYCMDKLTKDAIDLINRQKEEISKKDIEIDILIRKKEDLSDEVSDLRAEVERLKDVCSSCCVLKAKSETISDLNEQIEYWQRGYNDLRQEIKKAKSEAYKEFAERLKEKSFTPLGTWFTEKVVTDIAISNILKELTEVSNGE